MRPRKHASLLQLHQKSALCIRSKHMDTYPPVAPGISHTYGIGTQVKLPKLDLKKFNGHK